jgi:crotonobetainyl-CoA:carnitine CoA-transferase CaiB-like acyl-CoA transferase
MAGPLSNIRVIDLSRVLAAPWAAQNMADLGAEVIKVERPGKGDDSRAFGPPWLPDAEGKDSKESAYFLCANRGKKSITVDISKADGARIVRELAANADVLIENYKAGDLDRYGLGYAELSKLNPRLVYCSLTGFGQTGPYRERPGYDFMVQGLAGIMSVTGEVDDQPGGGPQRVGVPLVDIITGMYASIAICAALTHREQEGAKGRGQHIDMALLDCGVAILSNQGANFLVGGTPPARIGNAHPNIVPYQTFRTADGDVILAAGNDNLFRKFCELAGSPELALDARFATNTSRVNNRASLAPVMNEIFKERTTAEWVKLLDEGGVPCGPINNIQQVFDDPQVKARGLRIELDHPAGSKAPMVRSPMRFSETQLEFKIPPPMLGQHTEEILRDELGRSQADIAKLRNDGIV